MRKAIPPGMKLAITLHHLTEGASLSAIKYHWRIGKSTAAETIYNTCDAIWEELMPIYLQPPKSMREWKKISQEYVHVCPDADKPFETYLLMRCCLLHM